MPEETTTETTVRQIGGDGAVISETVTRITEITPDPEPPNPGLYL